MSSSAARILDLAAALKLRRGDVAGETGQTASASAWSLESLAGRLVELSGEGDAANLTLAFGLVLAAQRAGEPVAWLTSPAATFYPPDVAAAGVDLAALAVVRVPEVRDLVRAADQLARSGAFGLLVIDLGDEANAARVSLAVQSRLLGLVQRHDTVLLFLTRKRRATLSLGSLIALRGVTRLVRTGEDRFSCLLHAEKDKRGMPGWSYEEVCRGPAGLH